MFVLLSSQSGSDKGIWVASAQQTSFEYIQIRLNGSQLVYVCSARRI